MIDVSCSNLTSRIEIVLKRPIIYDDVSYRPSLNITQDDRSHTEIIGLMVFLLKEIFNIYVLIGY